MLTPISERGGVTNLRTVRINSVKACQRPVRQVENLRLGRPSDVERDEQATFGNDLDQ